MARYLTKWRERAKERERERERIRKRLREREEEVRHLKIKKAQRIVHAHNMCTNPNSAHNGVGFVVVTCGSLAPLLGTET